jgi:hypothetical protein
MPNDHSLPIMVRFYSLSSDLPRDSMFITIIFKLIDSYYLQRRSFETQLRPKSLSKVVGEEAEGPAGDLWRMSPKENPGKGKL